MLLCSNLKNNRTNDLLVDFNEHQNEALGIYCKHGHFPTTHVPLNLQFSNFQDWPSPPADVKLVNPFAHRDQFKPPPSTGRAQLPVSLPPPVRRPVHVSAVIYQLSPGSLRGIGVVGAGQTGDGS